MSDQTPTRDPRVTYVAEYHQRAAGVPTGEVPTNVDVPYVQQVGDALTCTMGNWTGEPTAYSYEWTLDDVVMGTGTDTYVVTVDDVGKTATCVVTAINAMGATTAPPSNEVVVESPT